MRADVFVVREGDDLRMVRGVVVSEDPLFPLEIGISLVWMRTG